MEERDRVLVQAFPIFAGAFLLVECSTAFHQPKRLMPMSTAA